MVTEALLSDQDQQRCYCALYLLASFPWPQKFVSVFKKLEISEEALKDLLKDCVDDQDDDNENAIKDKNEPEFDVSGTWEEFSPFLKEQANEEQFKELEALEIERLFLVYCLQNIIDSGAPLGCKRFATFRIKLHDNEISSVEIHPNSYFVDYLKQIRRQCKQQFTWNGVQFAFRGKLPLLMKIKAGIPLLNKLELMGERHSGVIGGRKPIWSEPFLCLRIYKGVNAKGQDVIRIKSLLGSSFSKRFGNELKWTLPHPCKVEDML